MLRSVMSHRCQDGSSTIYAAVQTAFSTCTQQYAPLLSRNAMRLLLLLAASVLQDASMIPPRHRRGLRPLILAPQHDTIPPTPSPRRPNTQALPYFFLPVIYAHESLISWPTYAHSLEELVTVLSVVCQACFSVLSWAKSEKCCRRMEMTAQRVLGGAHPLTDGIVASLRDARAALRARESVTS